MATFTVRAESSSRATDVWRLVTDWAAHGRFVPLTTVTFPRAPRGAVGDRFTARTAIGPLGFDDPMEVVEWVPPAGRTPGRCVLAKLGRLLIGGATIEVVPLHPGGCLVTWTEDVEIAPAALTRPGAPLVSTVGRLGFGRVLAAMVAEVDRR